MLNAEQLDFIRRHGITRCPPGPEIPMHWGPRKFVKTQPREFTEEDFVRAACGPRRVRANHGSDMAEQHMGKRGSRFHREADSGFRIQDSGFRDIPEPRVPSPALPLAAERRKRPLAAGVAAR